MSGGVCLHQGPLNVPPHLGHAAPGSLGQDPLLNGQRHRGRHALQAASHQGRLGRVQHPAPLHDLGGVKAHVHQGAAVIHDLPGLTPRQAQAGREQAGGVEPALLKPHHRRDPTIRTPLPRVGRQLTTGGQARRRQGLTPRRPRHQTVTGRHQLPQTPRPQTPRPQAHDPRGTGLLHGHDPVSLSTSHQRRIVPTVTSEQALVINTAGAVGIRALTAAVALVVVGVLGGDQQVGQQPLHHAGQLTTSGQGPQQTRHLLRRNHRIRRRVLGRRAQRPGRTTGREARKHTTFEHMYSIARPSTACTPKRAPESLEQQRKPKGTDLPGRRCTETWRHSHPGPHTHTPNQPTRIHPPAPANRFG